MTDVTPAQPAVTQNQMYVAQMVADHVTKEAQSYVKEMRRIADARLLDSFNHPGENGRQKSIEVMHDGVHLGTFTVVETASKAYVSDKDALIAWLEVHNPSALEITVEIRPNVLTRMLDVEGLVLADEDGGPVYRKKDGEILPGVSTKLAGEAVSTRATPFTGKAGAAKKRAAKEVLDRLAANFDVDQLAAQHAAAKAIEAERTVASEVVDTTSHQAAAEPRPTGRRISDEELDAIDALSPARGVDLDTLLTQAREDATGKDAEEIEPGVTRAEANAAAWHACAVQGGFSTPEIEAKRLSADRARTAGEETAA